MIRVARALQSCVPMKTHSSIKSASGIAGTFLVLLGIPAFAQTEGPTTGKVSDSSVSPVPGSVAPTLPSTLTATLAPAAEGGKISGTLKFSMAGNAANVTGRIEGLEPNKTYQLALGPEPSGAATVGDGTQKNMDQSGGKDVAPPPSQAGQPDAGKPVAPSPAAGTPDAGTPDGESRPGAPGAGTQGTPSTGSRNPHPALGTPARSINSTNSDDMGTITTDSTGSVNVNAVLRNEETADSMQKLAGRTALVRDTADAQTKTVAWGVIAGPAGNPEKAKPTKEAGAEPAAR